MAELLKSLGGADSVRNRYAAFFTGVPVQYTAAARSQLEEFVAVSGFSEAVIDYRNFTGQHGSASAVASVIAAECVREGRIPGVMSGGADVDLTGRRILVLGLGHYITAMELWKD